VELSWSKDWRPRNSYVAICTRVKQCSKFLHGAVGGRRFRGGGWFA
jgi:hypothetical protein